MLPDWLKDAASILTVIGIIAGGFVAIWAYHYSIGEISTAEMVQLGIKAALTLLEIVVIVAVVLGVQVYQHRIKLRDLPKTRRPQSRKH